MASTTVVVNTSATSQGVGPVTIVAADGNTIKRQSFNLTVQPLSVYSVGGTPGSTSPGTGTDAILVIGIPPYAPSCSGLPPGVTCTFSGDQLPYPSETTLGLTLAVPSGLNAGVYPFIVSVASGPETSSTGFTLEITDFALQAPDAFSDWVLPGGTTDVRPSVQSINDFSGKLTVTCSVDFGGSCIGGAFAVGGSVNGPVATSIDLSVSAPLGATTGNHTLTVMATNGSATHTAVFPFYIADFSGSLNTSTLTIGPGSNGSLTATVNATAGFDGLVSFACTGATQVVCGFSPQTLQPTAASPQITNITVIASASSSSHVFRSSNGKTLSFLALIFPFGVVFGIAGTGRGRSVTAGVTLVILLFVVNSLSCGGGGSGSGSTPGGTPTGGGGSTSYTITVNATAEGSNITRALGTVNVTVKR